MSGTSTTLGYLPPGITTGAEGEALVDVMQGIVAGITGIAGGLVRPLWQRDPPAQPTPDTNWIALGLHSATAIDHHYAEHDGTADGGLGRSKISRLVDAEFLLQFFGPNAQQVASVLKHGLTIRQNRDVMRGQGIGFTDMGEIVAVPDLVNRQWINRADARLRLQQTIVRGYAIRSLTAALSQIVRA